MTMIGRERRASRSGVDALDLSCLYSATVNGRRLRFTLSPVGHGEPPYPLWDDLLHVANVRILRRGFMTRALCKSWGPQLIPVQVGRNHRLAVPIWMAAAVLDGEAARGRINSELAKEFEAACDQAVECAAQIIVAALPAAGNG